MIDIHSHILPGIDDGSDSVETSLKMLNEYRTQGVTTVVATPHFYASADNVENFLKNRETSYNSLKEYISAKNTNDMPQILKGAEIHLTHNLLSCDNLDLLKIENTDFALLELPYDMSGNWVVNTLYEFNVKFNIRPILVHLERYLINPKNKKVIDEVLKLNLPVQINADSVLNFRLYKHVKRLIENQNVSFIAGDAHNMSLRKPVLDKAMNKLKKKFGNNFTDFLINNSSNLIDNTFEI